MISHARINECAERFSEEVIRLRREFHQHPELGFEEKRTASVIAGYLTGLGIEVKTGIAGTGVVGLLRGSHSGRTVMLRADMDALPIQELNEVDYRSIKAGIMHACGHDGHMAVLLVTARILCAFRDELRGQVKFVFQPAEENLGGARLMIEQGVLENPGVDAAFGMHLISQLPHGHVASRKGPFMAAMDTFVIRVIGKGGHSAMPGGSVDAIGMSARVVTDLQDHIRKRLPPETPVIVNIGTIHGGAAHNIVADRVELSGTVRCLDDEVRSSIKPLMEEFLASITSPRGGGYELVYEPGYPLTVNDAAMTGLVLSIARSMLGDTHVIDMPFSLASEDMSFYLREVPGCFFFVGAGRADAALNQPHHSPQFAIDERSLVVGLRMMTSIAVDYLGSA